MAELPSQNQNCFTKDANEANAAPNHGAFMFDAFSHPVATQNFIFGRDLSVIDLSWMGGKISLLPHQS